MARSTLPFYFHATAAAFDLLGNNLERAAVLAVKAVLKNQRSAEVAFQQVRYGAHHLAISSRVSGRGDLVVEIDVGDPRLGHHIVLEDDYRSADRKAREADKSVREAERRLRHRRW